MSALTPSIFNSKKKSFPLLFLTFLFVIIFFTCSLNAQRNDGQFVVVLDAGHGGHDPGNLGNGYLEKNIALNIVLKAGAILERTPGISVIYTRNDDTFVDLFVRGEIANKANADLFVSVHCDSHTSSAHGAGTFVLGLHANKQNFEIAKKENSVIYLEDNYESRYADYDINSPESVIGLTIMQEEFLDQSISLAKGIQHNFADKLKRKDRAVKQAGFIVLHQTFMPSVLVETGFLTNDEEGAYLNSKKGQTDMGTAIAEAIIEYKGGGQSDPEENSTMISTTTPDLKEEVVVEETVTESEPMVNAKDAAEEFAKDPGANPMTEKAMEASPDTDKVAEAATEEAATKMKVVENAQKNEMVKEVPEEVAEKVISETETPIEQEVVLATNEPKAVKEVQKEASKVKEVVQDVEKKEAATAASTKVNDKNIVFKVQLMASTKEISLLPSNFGGLDQLSKERFKQFHRYMYGKTGSYQEAKLLKTSADAKGYPGSYIVAYKAGARIPTPEAIKLASE